MVLVYHRNYDYVVHMSTPCSLLHRLRRRERGKRHEDDYRLCNLRPNPKAKEDDGAVSRRGMNYSEYGDGNNNK